MPKPTLYLFRGLPGSGKTTMANTLIKANPNTVLVEADMYFGYSLKEYKQNFNAEELPNAHDWCKRTVERYLQMGINVAVANTFTRQWEIQFYIDLAKKLGIKCVVYHCTMDYGNVHNVPESHVEKMRERWEPVDGEIPITD